MRLEKSHRFCTDSASKLAATITQQRIDTAMNRNRDIELMSTNGHTELTSRQEPVSHWRGQPLDRYEALCAALLGDGVSDAAAREKP